MPVKGGVVGSIAKLRSAVKRGSGAGFIKNIQADSEMTVRFLTEPTEWFSYFEHYDEVNKFFPCADDCPGCAEGNKPTNRWLANVLDVEDNNSVIALKLPSTLVETLMRRYERYGSIMTRDYELARVGSGLETKYEATPLGESRRKLDKYDLLDLGAMLDDLAPNGDSGDDDDDEPARPSRASAATRKRLARIKAQQQDEDDDDPDDDDDDEPPRRPVRRPARGRTIPKPGAARAAKEAETRKARTVRRRAR